MSNVQTIDQVSKPELPLVLKFLQAKTLEELQEAHQVKHTIQGHKASLNYHIIESDEGDLLACQCRGLIVASGNGEGILSTELIADPHIAAWPFNRFYNIGQKFACDIDYADPKTKYYEKLDGTLCIVYYDCIQNIWCVATRSIPEGNVPVDGWKNHTFKTLFHEAFHETLRASFAKWNYKLEKSITYMFELMTPINQIVVRHTDFSIRLLGARDLRTGKELPVEAVGKLFDLPVVPALDLTTAPDAVNLVCSRNPLEYEGVVVCDSKFNRVKIKNPEYVRLSITFSQACASPRNIVDLIFSDKYDDVLPLLPKYKAEEAEEMALGIRYMLAEHARQYLACLAISKSYPTADQRKYFAIAAKRSGTWMGPAMSQFLGQTNSIEKWIKRQKNIIGRLPNRVSDELLRRTSTKLAGEKHGNRNEK